MDALTTLLEQAEADRNRALAMFNQTRARSDAARTQAAQLDAYRLDYQQRWSAQFARGAGLDIVRCYQGFSDRLETAITQQAHAVTQTQAAQAQAGAALAAQELRVASVRKLIERRMQAQRQAANRREQKADDEHATRIAQAKTQRKPGSNGVRA